MERFSEMGPGFKFHPNPPKSSLPGIGPVGVYTLLADCSFLRIHCGFPKQEAAMGDVQLSFVVAGSPCLSPSVADPRLAISDSISGVTCDS